MWSQLTVQTTAGTAVEDPKELLTILTCSLKSLWGDLEPHSCMVRVSKGTGAGVLVVRCLSESVDAVRAALTLVSPPPYLESNIYVFDVVKIQHVEATTTTN